MMAYTIIKSDPINVNNSPIVDNMFLKQRFALFFSIATILIDYKKDIVKGKKVYKMSNHRLFTERRIKTLQNIFCLPLVYLSVTE